jgi:hypothetical protein
VEDEIGEQGLQPRLLEAFDRHVVIEQLKVAQKLDVEDRHSSIIPPFVMLNLYPFM